jgi:hypothetical protein
MDRRGWINVMESNDIIVFIDSLRGNFTGSDLAKNAVIHDLSHFLYVLRRTRRILRIYVKLSGAVCLPPGPNSRWLGTCLVRTMARQQYRWQHRRTTRAANAASGLTS